MLAATKKIRKKIDPFVHHIQAPQQRASVCLFVVCLFIFWTTTCYRSDGTHDLKPDSDNNLNDPRPDLDRSEKWKSKFRSQNLDAVWLKGTQHRYDDLPRTQKGGNKAVFFFFEKSESRLLNPKKDFAFFCQHLKMDHESVESTLRCDFIRSNLNLDVSDSLAERVFL